MIMSQQIGPLPSTRLDSLCEKSDLDDTTYYDIIFVHFHCCSFNPKLAKESEREKGLREVQASGKFSVWLGIVAHTDFIQRTSEIWMGNLEVYFE